MLDRWMTLLQKTNTSYSGATPASPTFDGAGNPIEHRFRGAAADDVSGVIYCPTQHVDWAGTYDFNNGEWGMIVSNTVEFTGTSAVSVVGPPASVIQDLDLQTITMKE